jgi:glycosyltransferase involved in cell wall biosynthesis
MPHTLLSVIVPVYNVENYISECLDSLLHQISARKEIIIINNGPNDGTLSLIDRYYAHLLQVKVINMGDSVLSNGVNPGITLARGQFLFFCNPDGVVENGLLKELRTVVEHHPDTDLFCFSISNGKGHDFNAIAEKLSDKDFGIQKPQDLLSKLLQRDGCNHTGWAYAVKKEVVKENCLSFSQHFHSNYGHGLSLSVLMACKQAWVSRKVYYKQLVQESVSD